MKVFRISRTTYAGNLMAPGISGRWNSDGKKMIYTGGSLALSCLEMLAHTTGTALQTGAYSVSVIEIRPAVKIEEVSVSRLTVFSGQWYKVENYLFTQQLGDEWLRNQTSAVLKVPSAIIDLEYNYLINPLHPEFAEISIVSIKPFSFDLRLKAN